MQSTAKDKTKWSLRAWLRRLFGRSPDHAASRSTAATDDLPSPRSNLTMAEKRMIMKATQGYWYVCRRNHPYLVGNCGVPLEFAVCPTCGDSIGGSGYTHGMTSGVARGSKRINGIF